MSDSKSREPESSCQIFHLEVRLPLGMVVERTNLRGLMTALAPEANWLTQVHQRKAGQGLAPHEKLVLCHYLAERLLEQVDADAAAEGDGGGQTGHLPPG